MKTSVTATLPTFGDTHIVTRPGSGQGKCSHSCCRRHFSVGFSHQLRQCISAFGILTLEEAAVVALIPWAPIEIVSKTCTQYDLYGYDAISNCYREAQEKQMGPLFRFCLQPMQIGPSKITSHKNLNNRHCYMDTTE